MPIGTSTGEYFDDHYDYTVRRPVINPNEDPRFQTLDQNVVTPNEVETRKQLDQSEQDPTTGTGIPIGLKRVYIYPNAKQNDMVEEGNIDLSNRPVVKNADGSISTVRSMSIGTDKGEVLIPTVHPEGRIMSNEEAIKHYDQTGQHLGIFKTPDAATRYAEGLHNQQADMYSTMPPGGSTEPAGALNSGEGGQVPGKEPETNFFQRLSVINPIKAMFKGPNIEEDKALLKGAWESIKSAFTLPGDVAQGTIDPNSPQGIQRAFDLASIAVMGPAPVASKIADGTLGSFAGVQSKTHDFKKAYQASEMARKGATTDEIWNQTGFFKGPDGRWRYEISDEGMKIVDKDWKFGETGKLSDFIEHPKLFEAYPELKDINFKVADRDYKYIGSYNSENKTLTVNPQAIKAGDEGILDVVAHELQHVIQVKEGFATGSNPERAFGRAMNAIKSRLSRTKNEEEINNLLTLYLDIRDRAKDFAEYMYLRTPGEVEANLVTARRKLSDQQRKDFTPEDTKKILEGSVNTLHGGKYLPDFIYPKQDYFETFSAMEMQLPGLKITEPRSPRWPMNDNAKPLNEFQQFIKDYDELVKLRESLGTPNKNTKFGKVRTWSELDYHKYNKAGREFAKKHGQTWEDVKPLDLT